MANSERTFQAELLTQMHKQGWHAIKLATPFLVGIPDLYVKAPIQPAVWIELKYMKRPGKIALTPLQRKFIENEQRVGGYAGWAVCTENGDMYAGNSPHVISLGDLHYLQNRVSQRGWDIQLLLNRIILGSQLYVAP
jgi:hypothetical protein